MARTTIGSGFFLLLNFFISPLRSLPPSFLVQHAWCRELFLPRNHWRVLLYASFVRKDVIAVSNFSLAIPAANFTVTRFVENSTKRFCVLAVIEAPNADALVVFRINGELCPTWAFACSVAVLSCAGYPLTAALRGKLKLCIGKARTP